MPIRSAPSLELAAEMDARGELLEWRRGSVELTALAGAARLTVPDNAGDRFVFYTMLETTGTFNEFMAHELWARVKGPMGRWNVTAGRFTVPYGLLTGFSALRYLYSTLEERVIGVDADNGVMVSGTLGRVDYAIAGTQGLGHQGDLVFPGNGLATGRIGVALGEFDQTRVGFSAAHGYTPYAHQADHVVRRSLASLDMTWEPGRLVIRVEASAGRVDWEAAYAAFGMADFALTKRFSINGSALAWHDVHERGATVFGGLTFNSRWITVRGGYRYEMQHDAEHHVAALQLYRRFVLVR